MLNSRVCGRLKIALSADDRECLQPAPPRAPSHTSAFRTAPLTPEQWLVCVAMASVALWFSELRKLAGRGRGR